MFKTLSSPALFTLANSSFRASTLAAWSCSSFSVASMPCGKKSWWANIEKKLSDLIFVTKDYTFKIYKYGKGGLAPRDHSKFCFSFPKSSTFSRLRLQIFHINIKFTQTNELMMITKRDKLSQNLHKLEGAENSYYVRKKSQHSRNLFRFPKHVSWVWFYQAGSSFLR